MPKAYDTWTVLPHKPIEKLEPNLWRVEGSLPGGNGNRVMTLVKLASGGLLVHNAIALEEDQMKEIEAFGTPKILVVPNGFHRLDAKVFKERYPGVRVLCPAGARKKVAQVVAVDGSYDDAPSDANVRLFHLDGAKQHEGVVEVKSASGTTLVFNDVINNLPKLKGMMGVMLAPTGRPSVPRIFRWFFVKDKTKFTAMIEGLAAKPDLVRVIVSHGEMLAKPAEGLRTALTSWD
ncbi:MAG TPA: hypothetical protein VMJ10_20560 [Kofleriaceae bacterium]|nr:hypothetical protein [Kofleriaceae bacterium]